MAKTKINESKEITYNIINSLLAGGLVFLGACSSSHLITRDSIIAAVVASLIVAFTKFSVYWSRNKDFYKLPPKLDAANLFSFIG